ncbi:MAG: amidohydrolase family protein [Clostridia bacterium]|nr:amidohydrolase family protein [Clostridia bacterium]
MEAIKKIDIHAHATAFAQYVPAYYSTGVKFPGAEDMISLYDKVNIEKGVLLPILSPEHQTTVMTNEGCMAIADQYPDRFVWFCNVDPRMGTAYANVPYLLEYYKSRGARGFGELTVPMYADSPELLRIYECLEALDLPMTIHVSVPGSGRYGIMDELGLPRLESILKRYPGLRILGHSQVFWSEISADNNEKIRSGYPTGKVIPGRIVDLMRSYGNLYCDLSAGSGMGAMMRDPDFTVGFFEEFSDRILYGCDICHKDAVHQYKFDEFLSGLRADGSICEETYRKIVRENAVKLLKL